MSCDIRSKNCFAILLNIHYCTRAIFYRIKKPKLRSVQAHSQPGHFSMAELLLYVKTTAAHKFPTDGIIGEAFAGYI